MNLGPFVLSSSEELITGPKIIFTFLGMPITITVVTTWIIMILIFLVCKFGTKNLNIIPGKFQTILESIYSFLDTIMGQILGKFKNKYFSFIGTMFIFILFSNLVSFFPVPWIFKGDDNYFIGAALRSPTSDINTTVGLGLLTTFTFIGTNIRYNGLKGYLKGFVSPYPIILPLNIAGEIAKPINISMRLFGNMFAGSVIIGIIYLFAPWIVPTFFHMYFDLVSAFVQTFVFVFLTMVYIQGGLPQE